MAKVNVIETVRNILEDFLEENGYELWNLEFVKSGKDFNLNIFIDSPNGIGTDDCELVSKFLSEKLDDEELIEKSYFLIVSSPGMDRPLLTDEHYERYKNTPVDVSLYKGFEGKKNHSGVLKERTDTELIILVEGKDGDETLIIPRDIVSKVRLQVIF